MAWVSPKVYAILSKSEEGKDILEGIADKDQKTVDKEVDAFFGKGGKGYKSNAEYSQAKMDDEAEERAYQEMGDEDVEGIANSEEDDAGSPYKEVDFNFVNDAIDDYIYDLEEAGQRYSEIEVLDDIKDKIRGDISPEDEQEIKRIIKERNPNRTKKEEPKNAVMGKKEEEWKTTKMASGVLYEKDGARYMYNDDDIPQLDKSVFKRNFEQAIEIGNYEKLKTIYDKQVKDKGVDSPEAKGTKLAMDEMSKNFGKKILSKNI
jgi:hypothetical protein